MHGRCFREKALAPASLPVIDESLNKNEKAKLFALLTHLRGGIYATQMEEFYWTLPFRRSFFRTADGAVSKGGSLWFPFFRPFFVEQQRKGIFAFTERAELCEAGYEGVTSLAKLPCPSLIHPIRIHILVNLLPVLLLLRLNMIEHITRLYVGKLKHPRVIQR